MIVAVDQKNAIGRNNQLLCHLSGDMKNFRQLTSGCPVIMGRKTFESLPNGPLPKRTNIVLSRNENYVIDGAITCESVEEALNLRVVRNAERVFVIGGEAIYKEFFMKADKLYLTCIRHTFDDADAYFPEVDIDHWRINSVSDEIPADEKNDFPYFFMVYEKIKGPIYYKEDEYNEI